MTLHELQSQKLRKLVSRWTLPVVALTVLGALVAFLVSRARTPTYAAATAVDVVLKKARERSLAVYCHQYCYTDARSGRASSVHQPWRIAGCPSPKAARSRLAESALPI